MSTPSRMTIAWDRLDQMALLPQDSSVVIPPPKTTIAWSPLLGPTIFDYDPSDFVVTPGANEEVVTPPGGGGGPPPAALRPTAGDDRPPSRRQAVPRGRPLHPHPDDRAGARAGGAADQSQREEGPGAPGQAEQGPECQSRQRRAQTDAAPLARRPDLPEQAEGLGLGDAGRGGQLRQRPEAGPAAPAREHRRIAAPWPPPCSSSWPPPPRPSRR